MSEESDKPDILIVDDVRDNLRFLSNFLVGQGYTVRKATTGQMALGAINALKPDLILLDIRMPDVSGYEICSALKAKPETATIPIIFLSAGDEAADKVKAFQVGGVDYIAKPFQLEEVLVKVQTQVMIQTLRRQLERQPFPRELSQPPENRTSSDMIALQTRMAAVADQADAHLSFIESSLEAVRQHIQSLVTLVTLYQQDCSGISTMTQALTSEVDLELVVSNLNTLLQSIEDETIRSRTKLMSLKNLDNRALDG